MSRAGFTSADPHTNGQAVAAASAVQAEGDHCGPRCASIKAEQLCVRYGNTMALANLHTRIEPCRITALVGPSGCGKTSFLRCLNRLTDMVPGCRVDGQVWIAKTPVHQRDTDVVALRRRVGMIFQKPNPFPMSIRKNLELPLRGIGLRDRRVISDRIEQGLRDVGLWYEVKDRLRRSALDLSGGQQQRLCLARALILEPEVLLLDEPCSALDPMASGVVEDLILSLRRRFTIVTVTHNLAQARRVADDTLVFWTRDGVGQLIEAGATEQVFEAPTHSLTASYVNGDRG